MAGRKEGSPYWLGVCPQQIQIMNEQNNPQGSIDPSATIDSAHVLLDHQLLARKKQIIQEFMRDQQSSDSLINYPNEFLQKMAVSQLKELGKLQLFRSVGTVYFGEVCNQLYHGYGLLLYRGDRLRFYEGYFQNNCKYGYGLEYTAGDIYVGRFVNNKPEDENGLYFWPNGDVYHGVFVNGMKHGQGKWQSGDQFYSGQWKYNKPEGQGFIRSALSQYTGDIKNGYKHGKGLQQFNNGDRYEGSYSNGKPEGQGAYFWSNGSVYRGEFKNGLRFGRGVWQFGKEKYQGDYVNDKRNGEGKYTWGGGSYYSGSFVEDLRHGFGEMHWDDSSYYKGEWFEGVQNGEGEVWQNGTMIEKGYYENGKLKITVTKEQSERRLLPLNTLHRRLPPQQNQTERKRFNSFQVNKESLKLDRLKNRQTANHISPLNKVQEKREKLKEVNKRYSAIPKSKGKVAVVSKSFAGPQPKPTDRSKSKSKSKSKEKEREREEQSAKTSINKINLYKRLRKQKKSEPLGKKAAESKLPKVADSQLFFETQLAPIKWRNFGHIN